MLCFFFFFVPASRRFRHHRMRRTRYRARDGSSDPGLSDRHGCQQKGHGQRKSTGLARQQNHRVHRQGSRRRDLGGSTSFR